MIGGPQLRPFYFAPVSAIQSADRHPVRVEGQPYERHPEFLCQADYRREHARQTMRLLMGIEVRRMHARRNCLFHLCAQFTIRVEGSCKQCLQQALPIFRKSPAGNQGPALDQHQMTTDIECWDLSRQSNRVVMGRRPLDGQG